MHYGSSLSAHDRIDGAYKVFGSNGQVGTHNEPLTYDATIVIGRKGSVGKVHFVDEPCWPIDTTYFVDAQSTDADLQWLYFVLLWLRLESLDKSSAIPGLNRNDAYAQSIPLPPLPEQQRIAALLNRRLALAEQLRAAAQAKLDAVNALPAALLRLAFAGELW